MSVSEEHIREALKTVKYPGFSRDIVSFGIVKGIELREGNVTVQLALATNDPNVPQTIKNEAENALRHLAGVREAKVRIDIHAPPGGSGAAGVGAGMASAQTDQTTGAGGSAAIEQVRSDAAVAPGAAIEAARSAEGAQTLAASAGQPVAADIEAVRSTEAAAQATSQAPFDIEAVRLAQGEALLASTSEPAAAAADIEAVRSTEAATQAASQAPFDIEGVRLAQGEQLLASEPAAAATDIEAVRSAANVSGLTAAESVEAARSTEIAASVASAQSATDIEAVRSAAAEATRAASDTGGGINISMPSPAVTGALGGAVALLITGAAFAARRRPPVQPA